MRISTLVVLAVAALLCGAAPLMGAELIYSFPLDSSPGWTTTGQWAFGAPVGGGGTCGPTDPASGYTGSNVYGYNLSGDYVDSMSEEYLTSTAIDCSGIADTHLVFWRWLGVDGTSWGDSAAVQVSNDGSSWTTVWQNPISSLCPDGWEYCVYDISAVADGDATVYVRWVMGPTSASWSFCGWNIDDIEIWSGAPGPYPVYTWNLNGSPGWTMGSGWGYGAPGGLAGDPASGHTGPNVYGYNLSGAYPNSMAASYLTTGAIDCSNIEGTTLAFWRWLGVEYGAFDHALVQVSNDGSTWTTVWQNNYGSYSIIENYWQLCVYDIAAIADGESTVYVRWQMGPTDSSVTYCGWNIDDIQIWNGPPLTILAWAAYADMGTEYPNTIQALADGLGDGFLVQPFGTNGQTPGDYVALSRQLEGKQVFLAVEQENATPTQATTAGTEFASTLQSFVSNGGTLAACGDGWRVWSGEFLTATGLMNATSVTSYPSGTLYVVEDWHPVVQGVGPTMAAQDGTTSYTVGAESLSVVQDGSGDTTLAVRDYGAGAVVLLGSDFYSYDADGAQLLANAVQYPKRQGRRVLLYDDSINNTAAEALRRLGYSYTLADYSDFDQLLTTQPWDLVVMDNAMSYLGGWMDDDSDYRSLAQYANAWGPALLDTWVLDLNPELTSAFGGTAADTIYTTVPTLYGWTASPFFTTPNSVPTTLSGWYSPVGYIRVGHHLTAYGTAYGGWTASATADEAAIISDNGGNSLVNSFLWDCRNQDAEESGLYDGDGVQDVVELVMNEIVYLARSPYVDMSFTPTATIPGTTVYYTAQTGPEVTGVDWDLGDGTFPSGWTPTHAYSEPGFYTVNANAYVPWGMGGRTATRALIVGFPDAAPGFWACNYIIACYEGGIVTGYFDGTYRPGLIVNRGAMAVYIARGLAGGDSGVPDGPATATFPDVPTDHWAYKYVEYAYAQGIVTGYWDGTYRPDVNVNRAAMAVYVARAVAPFSERPSLPGYTPPVTATFPDVATDHWAYKFVEYCEDVDVVGGYWDGTYRPDVEVDRASMAVYVQRAFGTWIPYS